MYLVDTHAHLDFNDFDQDRARLISELSEAKIAVINPATTRSSNARIDQLAGQHPLIWGAVGLHPTEITPETLVELPTLLKEWDERMSRNHKLIAVGEIGLDYFHRNHTAATQKAALRQMLTFALDRTVPVIFHCRQAYGDLVTILENYPGIRGVVHCFSGTQTQAEQFIGLGLHLSFTNNITYPANDQLRAVVRSIPFDRLMLETDAPFLPPHEQRGRRNDPRNALQVAQTVAILTERSVEAVATQTTTTAQKLFKIDI